MNTQYEPATDGETRIYRARQIEQILPRIREELGADAIVVAQREGLAGGVAGFFQQPFVEVHARPAASGTGLVDVYDDHTEFEDEAAEHFEPFVPTVQAPPMPAQPAPVHTPPTYAPAPPPAVPVMTPQAYVPAPETNIPMPAPQADVLAPHAYQPDSEVEIPAALAHALTKAELDRFAAHLEVAAQQPEPIPAPVMAEPAPVQQFVAPVQEQPRQMVMPPMPQQAMPQQAAVQPMPAPVYTQPEPVYAQPEPVYAPPEPVYAQPEPAPVYTQPEPLYAQAAPAASYTLAGPVDPRAESIIAALVEGGVPYEMAADIVGETFSHALPFGTPRQLKRLVREALARRIDVAPSYCGSRRALAIVGAPGAGKTTIASRLAAAYHQGGDLPVRLVALEDGAELATKRVWPKASEGIAVVDTPAVSPIDGAGIAELAGQLAALDLDEVHVALPATLSKPAAEQLLDALAPLGPTHLVLTHGDQTSHVGPAISLATERGMPFSFVNGSELQPADATDLARLVIG